MSNRIIVVVSGGNVQSCYADVNDIEVEVIDFDNLREEGEEAVSRAEAQLQSAEATMHNVY